MLEGLTQANFVSSIFVVNMFVFVPRPMKLSLFIGKTVTLPPKLVFDFLRDRDTFRTKSMDIVKDFVEKSYNNNNGKPWNSSRILRLKPNFLFSSFSPFLENIFFMVLHVSTFFYICFFIFCHMKMTRMGRRVFSRGASQRPSRYG